MKLPKNTFLFSVLIFIFSVTIFLTVGAFNNSNNSVDKLNIVKKIKMVNQDKESLVNIEAKAKFENKPVNILFAGDLMLDRYNRTIVEKNGVEHLTKKINKIFLDQDLNVVNLEGPVTENQTVSIDTKNGEVGHFKFTFDKKMSKDFLAYNKINLVNLGNNHILNFGETGAKETVNFLEENKVEYFGSPANDKNSYVEKEINGLKIAFVSYNRFYKLGSEVTATKIKDAKSKNDVVVVYAHWGNEYELMASEGQRNIAHNFIDNGADLIIGSHPHVVQPIEIYKNKAIFYSLGNFVFDQFFSEDVKTELLVVVTISEEEMGFRLEPIYRNQDGGIEFAQSANRNLLLERIANGLSIDNLTREKIKEGNFIIKNGG